MPAFIPHAAGLEMRTAHEVLRIEPWGPHSVRVRAAVTAIETGLPGALEASAPASPASEPAVLADGSARLVNGRITAEVDTGGRIRFLHTATGRELLAEKRPYTWYPGPRVQW
ncbi:hypothetical protein [Streptomyces sp. 6N223]|uniref:hypothetical protein n=1 Tax=Streptomyces sp. 6N223 TaxID=3457412 RepID=UPI003FD37ABC